MLVEKMIQSSQNVPNELKGIVSAICKGYIRHSKGMLSLSGIENVCNATFIKVEEDDRVFATENNFFGSTDTQILANGDVKHIMSYVDSSDKVKLIMILTHELGHVLTEPKVNKVFEGEKFPFVKRTLTYYINCYYEDGVLMANSHNGFRLADGFLEKVCEDIFQDRLFREEIALNGCDLGDYVYKDKRLFSSRVYDEFRDCFVLFNEIMGGKLFKFAFMNKDSDEEYVSFINENRLYVIYQYIDKTLESLWKLKKYETNARDEKFDLLVNDYFSHKEELLMVVDILSEGLSNQDRINELKLSFIDLSKFGNSLPFNIQELNYFNKLKSNYSK